MVADRDVAAGLCRGDSDFRDLTGFDVGIDLQRLEQKAVGSILAGKPQYDRLTFFQGNLGGREGEFLGLDVDHPRLLRRVRKQRQVAAAAPRQPGSGQPNSYGCRENQSRSPFTPIRWSIHSSDASPFPCLSI